MLKVLIIGILLCTQILPQDVFYVDENGSDCDYSDGSRNNPWQDFHCFNINDLPSGSIIKVRPGTYWRGRDEYILNDDTRIMILIENNTNITLTKDEEYTGEVIFDGNGSDYHYGIYGYIREEDFDVYSISIEGITFSGFARSPVKMRGYPSIRNISDVKITNCNFRNNRGIENRNCAGIMLQYVSDAEIRHCSIVSDFTDRTQNDGIYIDDSEDLMIMDNIIMVKNNYSESDSQPHVDCIQLAKSNTGPGCRNVTIERNYCENASLIPENSDRQGIHITYTSGDILVANNIIKSKKGDGLLNLFFNYDTGNFRVYNNTLYAGGDQRSVMSIVYYPTAAMIPIGPDLVEIKNNIIYKADSSSKIMAKFVNIPEKGIDGELYLSNSILNNNLYFIGDNPQNPYQTGFANYDGSNYTNERYKVWNNNWEANGIAANPLFLGNDTTLKVDYKSPAKNRGIGFYYTGIISDWHGNMRPYWNADFDIGAYEIEDTQLKIGVVGVNENDQVTHTFNSYGTYWERGTSGIFNISTNQSLASASFVTTGEADEGKLYTWNGYEYNWMDWSNNSSGKRIAAGFYKVSNNRSSAYFYLDLRDAVTNYNLNLYLLYIHRETPLISNYRYRNAITGSFEEITSGEVIRIWDINNNGNNNISGLGTQYWSNALVQVNGVGQNPRLIWGPDNPGYTVERIIHTWSPLTPDPISGMEFTDGTITICPPGVIHQNIDYRIVNAQSNSTNEVRVLRANAEKKNTGINNYEFTLNQNYPNPFNPSTNIFFSIGKQESVKLKIFDITGKEIVILVDGQYEPGDYNVEFNASQLSSGVYFYQITAGNFRETRKMQIIK
jgi:hypothetical protein